VSELKYKILKEEFDISQGLLKDLTKVVDELMKENKKLNLAIIHGRRTDADEVERLKNRVKELEAICTNVGELVSTMEAANLQTAWHILNNTGFIAHRIYSPRRGRVMSNYKDKLFKKYQKADKGLQSTFPAWLIIEHLKEVKGLKKDKEELIRLLVTEGWNEPELKKRCKEAETKRAL